MYSDRLSKFISMLMEKDAGMRKSLVEIIELFPNKQKNAEKESERKINEKNNEIKEKKQDFLYEKKEKEKNEEIKKNVENDDFCKIEVNEDYQKMLKNSEENEKKTENFEAFNRNEKINEKKQEVFVEKNEFNGLKVAAPPQKFKIRPFSANIASSSNKNSDERKINGIFSILKNN